MAQRTEEEEREYKIVPENISLCVKCGVGGNAANNLCTKCFSAAGPSGGGAKPTNLASADRSVRSRSPTRSSPGRESPPGGTSRDLKKEVSTADESPPPAKREVNRCSCCRRRAGLTGFRCRCGELFCAEHRYSDRHDCSFDYKSYGREAITRENPVVKAAKIIKI